MSYNELIEKVHSYLSLQQEEGLSHIEVNKRRSRFNLEPKAEPAPNRGTPPRPTALAAPISEKPAACQTS